MFPSTLQRLKMAKQNHELSRMDSFYKNPKEQLLEYVKNNETENICNLLSRSSINLIMEKYDYPYYKPILYIACEDLAQQILPSTISTLIALGADPHYIDEDTAYKEAIHFAVSGMNPAILRVILGNIQKENGINATTHGNTALHLLVNHGQVNTENFEKCLDLLLKFGIDVNKANKKRHTAILLAAFKGYKSVVTAILNCGRYVDIDSCKYDRKTAREYIIEKELYDGSFPLNVFDTNENSVDLPIKYIQERRVQDFLQLKDINVDYYIDEGTLLQLACERNLIAIVEYLINNGADVNATTLKNRQSPLEIVAEKGYYKIFKLLLNKYQQLPKSILIKLLSSMIHSVDEDVNYEECVRNLLEERKDIYTNEYSGTGNTPLHYASGLSDSDLTLKLLERGASLANKNKFNCLPIEDISPQTLEEHFNNCVDIKDQVRNDKQSIIVTFDYRSLIPTIENGTCKHSKKDDVEYEGMLHQDQCRDTISETGVVKAMSKIPEMRKLLIHPLISSYIFIKWYQMRWFFWVNLLLFGLFCASLITYVFIPEQYETTGITVAVWSVLILTYILLILREILQLILSVTTYFYCLSNYLEMLMLGICFYVIFFKSTELLYKQLSSIAMILVALEAMVLLGQHPSLSTNIVMLRTVTKNFFFFLCWYLVLILAFVLCFYKLFNNSDSKSIKKTNPNCTDPCEEEEQDFFEEPTLTFIKTIVMLTGEFDATSINFDSFLNRFIFLLFVFMVSIILFNLLNGLAVSDTQTIQSEAEIMGYIERINYIVYFENVILGSALSTNVSCVLQRLFGCCPVRNANLMPKCLTQQISLVPNFLSEFKMDILLYRGGKIIKGKNKSSAGCLTFIKNTSVDRKTIKRVKDLLNDKQRKIKETQQIKELQEIIKCQREIIELLKATKTNT